MQVHALAVGGRQNESSAGVARRTDGAEQIGPIVALVARCTRPATARGPDTCQSALLADTASSCHQSSIGLPRARGGIAARQSFFMRLLGGGVLLGTSWPHRYAPEAQPAQQIADRSFGQPHTIALLDDARQIDPAPAHYPMFGQIRSVADQLRYLLLLLQRELRFRSGSGSIMQSIQTFGVKAVHPITQNLSIHAAGYCRLAARLAFQH